MIKCKYFTKRTEYDDRGFSKLIYTPMSQFNKWNQADVESIISIDTCANQDGEIETIVVYYNSKVIDENCPFKGLERMLNYYDVENQR